MFERMVTRDLEQLESTAGHRWHNTSHQELATTSYVIKEADKGGATVILNTQDYLFEAEHCIQASHMKMLIQWSVMSWTAGMTIIYPLIFSYNYYI